jgi:hypothetical protein
MPPNSRAMTTASRYTWASAATYVHPCPLASYGRCSTSTISGWALLHATFIRRSQQRLDRWSVYRILDPRLTTSSYSPAPRPGGATLIMARLTDLPRALARVTRDVLGQVRSLSLQPWELENFAQGVPAPPPEFFAQVDELLGLEAAGLELADLLEIIDGLRDAYGAVSDHDPADLFARLFGPLLLCTMRADPSWRPYYPFVAAVLAADDALAEHSASRLLPDRYAALAARLWRQVASDSEHTTNKHSGRLDDPRGLGGTAYPVTQWADQDDFRLVTEGRVQPHRSESRPRLGERPAATGLGVRRAGAADVDVERAANVLASPRREAGVRVRRLR